MRVIFTIALVFIATVVGACGTSAVVDDLAQREANQIVAVLGDHGIDATTERMRGSKGRYSVLVSSGEFGAAISILNKLNLPRERGASFSELMAPSGILPASADVESLRMDRAIADEVEQLLLGHSGVFAASAVVRSNSVVRGTPASVSIVVQVREGVDQEQLRALVVRAVPGVRTEDVSLSVSNQPHIGDAQAARATEPMVPFLRYWRVPLAEYNGLALVLIGLFLVVAILAVVAGYIYGQYEATKGAETLSLSRNNIGRARLGADAPTSGNEEGLE